PLLPRGHELDYRHAAQRRHPAGRGRADRRRHGPDRRHDLQARGELMALRIAEEAVRTDTGRQRNANEDSLYVEAPLFVVADGMGGAQAGEVASKAAAESFAGELPAAPPERVLEETTEGANRTIYELARKDPGLAGMGTTTTAAIVDLDKEEVAIGHVGDSRAYRLRDGKFEQLTRDHSLVEE